MTRSSVVTGHEHRLHALKMLLISMHTQDPDLRGRYERLSQAWLALAECRERLAYGNVVGSQATTTDIETWMPISTAPRQEEIRLQETVWGPRVWLRNGTRIARARWRAEKPYDAYGALEAVLHPARWEDLDGAPLAFVPKQWRELDD